MSDSNSNININVLKQEEEMSETYDFSEQLKTSLAAFTPIYDAANKYAQLQEKESKKQKKAKAEKIKEFEGFVRRVKWAEMRRPQMMNQIFDKNHIDSEEKGYLMLEMAVAFKRVIPDYANTPIKDLMRNASQWINDANKERLITKEGGSKIHPSPHEGPKKFRYYVSKWKGDMDKQEDYLNHRVQSEKKTQENRKIEREEYERISTEPEIEQSSAAPEIEVSVPSTGSV